MRCEEKTGFLMLHRCGEVADSQCALCQKSLCSQHTFALNNTQMQALALTPTAGKTLVCLECFRQNAPQQGQQPPNTPQGAAYPQGGGYQQPQYGYRDPYYSYPYYGSYHPYHYGNDFSDRDRRAFDRSEPRQAAADQDGFAS